MARKLSQAVVEHAAQLVRAGSTLIEAARAVGCNADTLSLKLRALDIDTSVGKRQSGRRLALRLPADEIIPLYRAGMGVPSLATKYKCAEMTIRNLLQRNDVEIRSRTEANKIIAANKSREQHVIDIRKARAARHGNMVAAAYDGTFNPAVSPVEYTLANLLEADRIPTRRQVIVEGYLIDIVVDDHIAVEVKSKRIGPSANDMQTERAVKLIECGYAFVFAHIRNALALERHAKDILAAFQQVRWHPPVGSEYWVIRCGLYDLGTDYEIDEWSLIKGTPKGPTAIS